MIIRRALPFFCFLLFLGTICPLSAQEGGGEGELPIDSDWSGIVPPLYARGDQAFVLTGGLILPTLFLHHDGAHNSNLYLGGTGAFGYTYFLNSQVFIGGELEGMFAGTKGRNTIFMVAFGFKAGYQFVLGRFEFPLSLMIGGCPQKFQDDGYFGLIVKPSASAFFRFNSDWSFGVNADWWWVPQWTGDQTKDVYANFLGITLSARYHL
jgi:hypothetical protein